MPTKVEVCNRALLKIGASLISDPAESSAQARVLAALFDSVARQELRKHAWSFAMSRALLPALVTAPTWGYVNAFQLPSDCLRVVYIGDAYFDPTLRGADAGDKPPYLIEGRLLLTDQVLPDMEKAWRDSAGELFEERLMRVITAGRDAGGDAGGHRSACLLCYDTEPYGRTDLRVDFAPKGKGQPDAVDLLRRAFDQYKPMIPYYKVRPHNPTIIGWIDGLKTQGIDFKD